MTNATQVVKVLLALCTMFLMISAGVLCIHVATAVDQTAAATQKALVQMTKDADDLKVMTNATLYQAEETLHELSDMARTEKSAQKSQLSQVNKVLDQLTLTVQNVDKSQAQMSASMSATLQSVQPVMEQTQATIADLDSVIKDPNIPSTLAHVNNTMDNLQNTTKSVDIYVKRITTPRGFVSTLWHGVLSLVTPGASVAIAIK